MEVFHSTKNKKYASSNTFNATSNGTRTNYDAYLQQQQQKRNESKANERKNSGILNIFDTNDSDIAKYSNWVNNGEYKHSRSSQRMVNNVEASRKRNASARAYIEKYKSDFSNEDYNNYMQYFDSVDSQYNDIINTINGNSKYYEAYAKDSNGKRVSAKEARDNYNRVVETEKIKSETANMDNNSVYKLYSDASAKGDNRAAGLYYSEYLSRLTDDELEAQKKLIEDTYGSTTLRAFDAVFGPSTSRDEEARKRNDELDYQLSMLSNEIASRKDNKEGEKRNGFAEMQTKKYKKLLSVDNADELVEQGKQSDGNVYVYDMGHAGGKMTDRMKLYNYLNDDEEKVYNILVATGRQSEANEYFDNLRPALEYRQSHYKSEAAQAVGREHPVFGTLLSAGTNVIGSAEGLITSIAQAGTGGIDVYNPGYNTSRMTQGLRGGAQERVNDTWLGDVKFLNGTLGDVVYGTTTSMLDMGVAMALTGGVTGGAKAIGNEAFGNIVSGVMSAEAFTPAIISAKERGLSDGQAISSAIVASAAEYLTEKFSIEALLGEPNSKIGFFLKNFFAEGSEEVASDVINDVYDIIANGDMSELRQSVIAYMNEGMSGKDAYKQAIIDKAQQMGVDFTAGALSGGVMAGAKIGGISAMEGINNAFEKRAQKAQAKAQTVVDTAVDSLVNDDIEKATSQVLEDEEVKKTVERVTGATITEDNAKEVITEFKKNNVASLPNDITATVMNTGEKITVSKVLSGTGTTFSVVDTNGKIYDTSSLAYSDKNIDTLLEDAKGYGYSANTTKTMIDTYLNSSAKGVEASLYTETFNELQSRIRNGYSLNEILNDSNFSDIFSDEVLNNAYTSIVNEAQSERNLNNIKSGKVNEGGKFTGTADRSATKFFSSVAQKTGINIVIDGKIDSNGKFDAKTNTITLKSSDKVGTLFHELMEAMRAYSPESREQIDKAVNEWYKANNLDDKLDDRIRTWMGQFREFEGSKTYSEASSEHTNDVLSYLFLSDEGMEEFTEWLVNDSNTDTETKKNILTKLKELLDDFIEWVKNLNKGFYEGSLFEELEEMDLDKAQNLRSMLLDALDEIGKMEVTKSNYISEDFAGIPSIATNVVENDEVNNIELYENEAKKFKMPLGGGKTKLVTEATTKQILMDAAYKYNVEKIAKQKIAKVTKILDKMAVFMKKAEVIYTFIDMKDVNNAKITYDESTKRYVFSAMVKNGEYPVNFDLTTICKKRDAASRFISELMSKVDKNGNKISQTYELTEKNLGLLNEALRESGYETACLGCFVEAKRYTINNWAKTIVKEWNESVLRHNPNATYLTESDRDISAFDITEKDMSALNKAVLNDIKAKKQEAYKRKLNSASEAVANAKNDLQVVQEVYDEVQKTGNDKKKLAATKSLEKAKADYEKAKAKLEAVKDSKKEESTITPTDKADALIKNDKKYQKLIRISDIVTKEGIDNVSANYSGLLQFVKTRFGTASPKLTQGFTPYNSEIALLQDTYKKKSLADYLYSIGGIRAQSFSDFKIEFVFDYLQMFADAYMRNLPMHAYTKEISFAKLFGRLGAKINMSVMYNVLNEDYWSEHIEELESIGETETDPAELSKKYAGMYIDENGNLAPLVADKEMANKLKSMYGMDMPVQSVDYNEAVKLMQQEGYSSNITTIGVGFSDYHIRHLLRSNDIGYVIPYHRSSLPTEIGKITNLNLARDYTSVQNTLEITKLFINGEESSFAEWINDYKKSHNIAKFDNTNSIEAVKEFNRQIENGTIKISTKKASAAHGDFNVYTGKYGLNKTNDPKATTNYYVADCLEHNNLPMFYEFADEPNYYKMHFDFGVYDNATGEYAKQGAVGYDIGDYNEFEKTVDGYLSEMNEYREKQYTDEKIDSTIELFKNKVDMNGDKAVNSIEISDEKVAQSSINIFKSTNIVEEFNTINKELRKSKAKNKQQARVIEAKNHLISTLRAQIASFKSDKFVPDFSKIDSITNKFIKDFAPIIKGMSQSDRIEIKKDIQNIAKKMAKGDSSFSSILDDAAKVCDKINEFAYEKNDGDIEATETKAKMISYFKGKTMYVNRKSVDSNVYSKKVSYFTPGSKFVFVDKMTEQQKLYSLDNDWNEICDIFPSLNREESDGNQVDMLYGLWESVKDADSIVKSNTFVSNVEAKSFMNDKGIELIGTILENAKELKSKGQIKEAITELKSAQKKAGTVNIVKVESVIDNLSKYIDINSNSKTLVKRIATVSESYLKGYITEKAYNSTISSIAKSIVRDNNYSTSANAFYKIISDHIQENAISVTDEQKKQITQKYGSYERFLKQTGLNISENGMPAEILLQEIQSLFGITADVDPATAIVNLDMINNASDVSKLNGTIQAESKMLTMVEFQLKNIISESQSVNDIVNSYFEEKADLVKQYEKKIKDRVKETKREAKRGEKAKADFRVAEKEFEMQYRLAEQKAMLDKKNAKKIANLLASFEESLEKGKIKDQEREMRNKIKKSVKDMVKKLNHPTRTSFVPATLKNATLAVLRNFDVDSLVTRNGNVTKSFGQMTRILEGIKESTGNQEGFLDDLIARSQKLSYNINLMNLDELQEAYQILRELEKRVVGEVKGFKDKRIRNVYELAYNAKKSVENAAHSFKSGIFAKIESGFLKTLSPRVLFNRLDGHTGSMGVLYDMLSEGSIKQIGIRQRGNEFFAKLTKNKEFKNFSNDIKLENLKDNDGKQITITRGIMLSLYMHLLNEDNRRHIAMGGFTLPELKAYYNGDFKTAFSHKKNFNGHNAVLNEIANKYDLDIQMAEEDGDIELAQELKERKADEMNMAKVERESVLDKLQKEIESNMTEFEKQYVEAAQKFFEFSRDVVNEATVEQFGYEVANEENYFPIVSDKDLLGGFDVTTLSNANIEALENAGLLKQRVKSSNAINLEDISSVINKHNVKIAQIGGLMNAINVFNNVYNARFSNLTESSTLKTTVSKIPGANEYITKLLENLVAGTKGNKFAAKIRSLIAQGSLNLNLRVAVSQAVSYIVASPYVGAKNLTKAISQVGRVVFTKADIDLINKYTPLLKDRMDGMKLGSDDYQNDISVFDRKNAFEKAKDAVSLDLIRKVDIKTVRTLWYACEYKIRESMPDLYKAMQNGGEIEADDYYEEVAELFNKVVLQTQPQYTMMERSDLSRSDSEIVKSLMMFSTQRNQNYNLLVDSIGEFNAKSKAYRMNKSEGAKAELNSAAKKLVSTITSQVLSAVSLVALKLAVDALQNNMKKYRDDDDELTEESISSYLIEQSFLTFAGNIPMSSIVSDIVSTFVNKSKYYGINMAELDTINTFITSTMNLVQKMADKNVGKDDIVKEIKSLSIATGIPYNNLYNLFYGGIYVNIKKWSKGDFGFESTAERKPQQEINIFAKKVINGEDYDSYLDEISSNNPEHDYKNNLTKWAKETYLSYLDTGKPIEDVVKVMEASGYYSKLDIIKKQAEWTEAYENGYRGKDGQKQNDYVESNAERATEWVSNPKTIKKNIDSYVKEQVKMYKDSGEYTNDTEKKIYSTVKSSLTSACKKAYMEALKNKDKSQTKKIRTAMINSGLYGKTKGDSVDDKFKSWSAEYKKGK